ncbi:MAG: iron-containing alcohol dehydrogenase, partial [Acidobacteriota bacterium]|nr:iron-containing alcohol dehydrogenase [Acidobacteriota bacterium]
MRFEFATAARIVFGPGSVSELPKIASAWGKRAFVVTGRDKIRHAGTVAELEAAGFHCALFGVAGEPAVPLVREGAQLLKDRACTVVIAIGGGSAIDAAKAIAAIAANPGDVLDYLEVVGQGKPLPNAALPFIAVPTTAGTGSEVTRNAVLGSPEDGVKASLRSASMLAKVALVDPELTYSLGKFGTATTGLDAITQLIEPYVSPRANPMTDALCRDGLRMAAPSLRRAYANPKDAEARTRMSYASLLGGLALANAGLGVVHGFAAPVGGMFDAPHGAICAALLPHGMRANIAALKARAPESESLARYGEVARILTGDSSAAAEDGAVWIEGLVRDLGIPGLRSYGIGESDVPALVGKAARASSMKANPIVLTNDELGGVL